MAVIATLKPVETTHVSSGYSTASIPLNKLVPWDGNVRKTEATKDIEELVASIEAHGILQSLVVKKTSRGKFSIIAGRRRYHASCILVEHGKMAFDAPVPCQIVPSGADSAEISLVENVVRAPMHPADQFEAFSALVDDGSTPAEIAARFGISETAVKQRLKLARVSPTVFQAYKDGKLSLEQVQAFTVSDDHAAQDNVLENLSEWNDDADTIRDSLTENDIRASDKRARFVTVAAYEEAGGAVRRDLFAEDDQGVFLLDSALLDRLALDKLKAESEKVKAEGWKWVDVALDIDHSEMDFRVRRPEPVALSDDEDAEHKRLSEEYTELFDQSDEPNEETSERLEAIEERIAELEDREKSYTPETLAIAGTIVTLRYNGEIEVLRGLVRPEDASGEDERSFVSYKPKESPEYSAKLVESLTAAKSAAIGAALSQNPSVALAAVVHGLAISVFGSYSGDARLQVRAEVRSYDDDSKGASELKDAYERWSEQLPGEETALWEWCLEQEQHTLLDLLAFCAGCAVDTVTQRLDSPSPRVPYGNALASALNLDMKQWFTPTAENFFKRVGRQTIINAIKEATGKPSKRSWEKYKKSELASLAERETAGKGWLPQPLKA